MTKKERIEYYRLIEPKLREIFINNEFMPPSEAEFQKLNLSAKNREEFLTYFKDAWFNIEHFTYKAPLQLGESIAQLEKLVESMASNQIKTPSKSKLPKLQLPSSSALFQISRSIDIEEFYRHLKDRNTFIAVHKETGVVAGSNVLSTLSINFKNLLEIIKKDPTQYEVFEIEDHALFCKLLEEGNFNKIKKAKLFENEIFEVPEDYPLFKIIKRINLYAFADALNEGKPLMRYNIMTDWYSSFEDVNDYHSFNDNYNKMLEMSGYKPIDRSKETDDLWFYAENPLNIRQEILFGNFKILKKIKIIENIFTFLSNNDG